MQNLVLTILSRHYPKSRKNQKNQFFDGFCKTSSLQSLAVTIQKSRKNQKNQFFGGFCKTSSLQSLAVTIQKAGEIKKINFLMVFAKPRPYNPQPSLSKKQEKSKNQFFDGFCKTSSLQSLAVTIQKAGKIKKSNFWWFLQNLVLTILSRHYPKSRKNPKNQFFDGFCKTSSLQSLAVTIQKAGKIKKSIFWWFLQNLVLTILSRHYPKSRKNPKNQFFDGFCKTSSLQSLAVTIQKAGKIKKINFLIVFAKPRPYNP